MPPALPGAYHAVDSRGLATPAACQVQRSADAAMNSKAKLRPYGMEAAEVARQAAAMQGQSDEFVKC